MTNKKAFSDVLRFMVGLVLSILMLFFFFSCSSKIFGTLTDQGKQSFVDFTKQLKAVEQPEVSISSLSKTILILDEGTALVYFQPNVNDVRVTAKVSLSGSPHTTYFNNPKKCAADKGCLCLFRKSNVDLDTGLPVIGGGTSTILSAIDVVCQEFDTSLILENCGFGTPHSIDSYICSNGFVIDRLLISKYTSSYFENPRRVVLGVEKRKTDILLKG